MQSELINEHLELALSSLGKDMLQEALNHYRSAQQLINDSKMVSSQTMVRLACGFIDCGSGLHDVAIVSEGLAILESRFNSLAKEIKTSDLEYYVGNAKKFLYDVKSAKKDFTFQPESIAQLTEAKNCYWRAYQTESDQDWHPGLLVNLASSLDQCGRVTESFYWYNKAIEIDPNHSMAHLNRGMALLSLNRVSHSYSIKLLCESKRAFDLSLQSGRLQQYEHELARKYQVSITKQLLQYGWTDEKLAHYEEIDKHESLQHDHYRQFCLTHNLALCEHALYCHCVGARRDDLSIPTQSGRIGGDFVPKLELILNRAKSEFCLARALYYQATVNKPLWDTNLYEGTFTDLHENEAIGLRSEFLRTSFRLCFGILDSIAQGLNELYGFAKPAELLSFESFWKQNGQDNRWKHINKQRNIALVGLYSIATDLNKTNGPWKSFKEHRNSLEHGILILLDQETTELTEMVTPMRISIKAIPLKTFKNLALLLLQLTASAIFNFVFCARLEGRRLLKEPGISVTLNKKLIGKK